MKKLLLLTFIIVAVFISCKHPSEEEYYPILPDYSSGFDMVFDNIPDLGLSTILSVMGWVSEEIDYVPDYVYHNVDEYWQSPGETYDMQTGDCEDYSILAMYLIYRRDIEPKIIPEMVVGYMYKGSGLHAWVRVDGEDWEPQSGSKVYTYITLYTIAYEEAIYRSNTTHKALRKK